MENYQTLKFDQQGAVMFVTIDSPPINLMTLEMAAELGRFATEVAGDDSVKVMVFKSANPDYFIAHFDVTVLAQYPSEAPPKPAALGGLAAAFAAFREMPKVSIAQVEGRARGGGSEFILSLDMRFGALGKTLLAQPEIAVGILPGGGGTQLLPRLIGRARAIEVILGGRDLTAEMAERYGYLNRALPADEIDGYVRDLAFQIASYSHHAIALNKRAINNAEALPLVDGLLEETYLFGQLAADEDAKRRMHKFLDGGGQTFDGELDIEKALARMRD